MSLRHIAIEWRVTVCHASSSLDMQQRVDPSLRLPQHFGLPKIARNGQNGWLEIIMCAGFNQWNRRVPCTAIRSERKSSRRFWSLGGRCLHRWTLVGMKSVSEQLSPSTWKPLMQHRQSHGSVRLTKIVLLPIAHRSRAASRHNSVLGLANPKTIPTHARSMKGNSTLDSK